LYAWLLQDAKTKKPAEKIAQEINENNNIFAVFRICGIFIIVVILPPCKRMSML